LTLLEMKKKTILDDIHLVKVTSSQVNTIKRRSVSVNPADDVISSKHLLERLDAVGTGDNNDKQWQQVAEARTQKSEIELKDAAFKRHQAEQLRKEISHYNKLSQGLRGIGVAYFVQCLLRLTVDIVFAHMQCRLFEFNVPNTYKCARWPCPDTVS